MSIIAILIFGIACKKENSNNDNGGTAGGTGDGTHFNVTITTVAGKQNDAGNAEDGNGAAARFFNPTKMVLDNRNNILYIADGTVIRSMDAGNNVSTYVPLNTIGNSFNEILDIALAPGAAGSLYLTTKENDLWKISPDANSVKATKIIGRVWGGNETGPVNTGFQLDRAAGLAVGKQGEIYFFNTTWNTIHRITMSSETTGVVESFAGKPEPESGGNGEPYPFSDGLGENATFNSRVVDMTSDNNGNLYVGDFDNNIVRKITPGAMVSSMFPYKGRIGIDLDGSINDAKANTVQQVAVTGDGSRIFFSTWGSAANNLDALRLLRPGKDVTTLAKFNSIGGLAAADDGKTVFVSEPYSKIIKKVTIQ